MQIPNENNLAVDKLLAVFNDTTNSYKFFWVLAILESLKEGKTEILLENLVAKMIARV